MDALVLYQKFISAFAGMQWELWGYRRQKEQVEYKSHATANKSSLCSSPPTLVR